MNAFGTYEATREAVLAICRSCGRPAVLDVGCGDGRLLVALSPRISRGCGIDVSPAAVDAARRRARGSGNLDFQVLGVEHLVDTDVGLFDVVLFVGSLEHVSDARAALDAARRRLRAGGCIVVVAIAPRAPHAILSRRLLKRSATPVVQHLGVAGLRRLGARAGLRVAGVQPLRRGRISGNTSAAVRLLSRLLAVYDRIGGATSAVTLVPGAGTEASPRTASARGWRDWIGILRSLVLYRRPGRQRGLRRFYRSFIAPGDLVFDIGAHVGDRSRAFASLGARVVALEPNPGVVGWLERLARHDGRITVRMEAVGRSSGTASLAVSRRTPTVSTLSDRWRTRLPHANAGFRGVRWDDTVTVPVTTLDALIREHGVPAFCKIDVEGHEAEVLRGLGRPLPALSVEFVQGALDIAAACVRRLQALGPYEFNAVAGEHRHLLFEAWQAPEAILEWLDAGAADAPSGDLYARTVHGTGGSRA